MNTVNLDLLEADSETVPGENTKEPGQTTDTIELDSDIEMTAGPPAGAGKPPAVSARPGTPTRNTDGLTSDSDPQGVQVNCNYYIPTCIFVSRPWEGSFSASGEEEEEKKSCFQLPKKKKNSRNSCECLFH